MERSGVFIQNANGKCGMNILIQFCMGKKIDIVNKQVTRNFILH